VYNHEQSINLGHYEKKYLEGHGWCSFLEKEKKQLNIFSFFVLLSLGFDTNHDWL
jgi:hypothetical protein